MFVQTFFVILASCAASAHFDASSIYTHPVDLSFWPDWKGHSRYTRCSIDLVSDTARNVRDIFCTGPSSALIYANIPAHKQGLDARLIGWRILQGQYEIPANITAEQLKLLLEWSRIVLIFQSGVKPYTEQSKFLTRLANMPVIIPRVGKISPDVFESHLIPARSLNVDLWDCMHSLALQRLIMSSDHMLAAPMARLWQRLKPSSGRLVFKEPQRGRPSLKKPRSGIIPAEKMPRPSLKRPRFAENVDQPARRPSLKRPRSGIPPPKRRLIFKKPQGKTSEPEVSSPTQSQGTNDSNASGELIESSFESKVEEQSEPEELLEVPSLEQLSHDDLLGLFELPFAISSDSDKALIDSWMS